MKTCTKCKETKPLDDFPKDRTHKDGYRSACKICRNNDPKYIEYRQQWSASHPEYMKEAQRAYRKKNQERFDRGLTETPAQHHCSRCNQTKSADAFWPSRAMPNGLQYYCIECTNEYKGRS